METEYKNYFAETVLANNVLINKLKKTLNNMKQESHLVVSNEKYKAYLYQDLNSKIHYLILEDEELTTMYSAEKTYQKPFQRFLEGDLKSLKYNADKIISLFNSKDIEEQKNKKVEEYMKDYPLELREYIRASIIRTMEFAEQSTTSSAYQFRMFIEFLENNGFSKEFDKEFLYKNPDLYKKVQERVPEFGIILESIKEALKSNNITEKNKFEYNDLDNHIWKNSQYILSTEQNFSWVIDVIDQKNFTIYAALSPHNGNGSKAKSMTGLLKKVKSGEEIDFLDYVGLRVENGEVIYANNSFMYSLDFNIMINKNVLEEEGLLKPDYGDVDVKSFDYQFAYSNKRYNTGKVSFLIHALFILGNGYAYDKEEGKIYSDVKFIPNLLDGFEYKETKEDREPIKSLIYLAPPKLEYLEDRWLENLKYIVNKIKTDKPDLSKTHTSYLNGNQTPEEVLEELDKVIKYNENLRKHKPKV